MKYYIWCCRFLTLPNDFAQSPLDSNSINSVTILQSEKFILQMKDAVHATGPKKIA